LVFVTIVWTATHPDTGGTLIVGWYKNATIFRYYQEPDKKLDRYWEKQSIGYCMFTKTSDSRLLSKDERIIKVPRGAKGMGQTNIWYGDNNPDFVKNIGKYLLNGTIPEFKRTKVKTKRFFIFFIKLQRYFIYRTCQGSMKKSPPSFVGKYFFISTLTEPIFSVLGN